VPVSGSAVVFASSDQADASERSTVRYGSWLRSANS
jgi:hypothetical protein